MAEPEKQRRNWLGRTDLDQAVLAGGAASLVWLILLLLLWWLTPASGAEHAPARGGSGFATTIAALLPFALIWLAVFTVRALAGLRDEAHSLRAELLALRGAAPGRASASRGDEDDLPPRSARPPVPHKPAARAGAHAGAGAGPGAGSPPAASARAADVPQSSLDLDGPKAVEVSVHDLIAALNFPDGPDDRVAVEALRRALADDETARLIRAAQDVVTLLAGHGLYMDDLRGSPAAAGVWRKMAEGSRGASLAALAVLPDEETRAALAELLRREEVLRDAAHYFLRRWDRMLARETPQMSDAQVERLAVTRSGRAFSALAQATGMLG